MRITVLGGQGAWPTATQACSGYLLEQDGFTVLVDPGYATLPLLLARMDASDVDAVLVSHGHPDHCADLHPLVRARVLGVEQSPPLPVHALPGAVDLVMALDGAGRLDHGVELHEFTAGDQFDVGPFVVQTQSLPHFVPNAGFRVRAGGHTVAYTGDTGPSADIVALARSADVFLAEASFADEVPTSMAAGLSSGRQAGENAQHADVGRLLLTHLWPGVEPERVVEAARQAFTGPVDVATTGAVIKLT